MGELMLETQINSFLDKNGLDLLFRGHESPEDGICISSGGRIWTIFGATNYLRRID